MEYLVSQKEGRYFMRFFYWKVLLCNAGLKMSV